MSILAFLMMGPDGGGSLHELGAQLPYAGAALVLVGMVWALGRAVIFRKGERASFYPFAAILLGVLACGVGVVLKVL